MDLAEDVLEAQKAGKKPSGPLGVNCLTETSNSSSFWRAPESANLLTGNLPNFFVPRPAAAEL